MEMKRIIYEVFSNRLGNVLAISNIVFIAITASGALTWLGLKSWIFASFLVDLPAQIASAIVFSNPLIPFYRWPTGPQYYSIGTLIFIYFQWLAIGWIAGKISRAIQPFLPKLF